MNFDVLRRLFERLSQTELLSVSRAGKQDNDDGLDDTRTPKETETFQDSTSPCPSPCLVIIRIMKDVGCLEWTRQNKMRSCVLKQLG